MRRRAAAVWVVLLAVGLAMMARPAARRVQLVYDGAVAAGRWERALADPGGGRPGEPCAWLSVPGGGLETLVLEGAEPGRLRRAPCLDRVAGNTVVLGHRDTHFAGLQWIGPGERVTLEDRRGTVASYTVTRTLVLTAAGAEEFLRGSEVKTALILVTCHPFGFVGPAPDRFLVIAEATGRASPRRSRSTEPAGHSRRARGDRSLQERQGTGSACGLRTGGRSGSNINRTAP